MSILIGVNDVWHENSENPNGVDAEKFYKIYDMLIEEIKAAKRNPEYKSLPSATYKAIRLLSSMPRILENRNVQVVEDRTGRKTLKYPSRVENLKLVANKVKHKVKTLKK